MHFFRSLALALLAMLALNSLVLADGTSVFAGWSYGTTTLFCADGGNPSHCSDTATITDPFGDVVPLWVSPYAFSTSNSLTFHLDFSGYGFFTFFGEGDINIQGLGTLTDKVRLSRPVPAGSYAEFDVTNPYYNVDSSFCDPNDDYFTTGIVPIDSSFTCGSDSRLTQPFYGNILTINAFIQQDLIANLVFDVVTPVDATYSFEDIQIFDKHGKLIPETFTPLPERASLWLLLPIAGFFLCRATRQF